MDPLPKFSTKAIAAALVFSVAPTCASFAASITDFVETPDTLSFNFSGTGFFDLINLALPVLTYWEQPNEGHFEDTSIGTYGFGWTALRHLPDGPFGDVGGANTPLGTTLSDTRSFPHGTALDIYSLSITVQNDGHNEWGDFSGSFSAVHSTSVPDAGSTALLLGLTSLGLVAIRGRPSKA